MPPRLRMPCVHFSCFLYTISAELRGSGSLTIRPLSINARPVIFLRSRVSTNDTSYVDARFSPRGLNVISLASAFGRRNATTIPSPRSTISDKQ